MNKPRETKNLLVALDIGTSKIIAIVAEITPDGATAYVASFGTNTVVPLDVATGVEASGGRKDPAALVLLVTNARHSQQP